MTVPRRQRLALAVFPPHFKARYGAELAALVADRAGRPGATWDLLWAAGREWMRPSWAGDAGQRRTRRLEATTATVWACWCASVVAVAAFARAVDDQPVPGLRSWGWSAYRVGSVIFEVTGLLVAVGGGAVWLRVVAQAWRAKARPILVWAVLPAPVVVIWLGSPALVRVTGRHIIGATGPPAVTGYGPQSPGAWVLLSVFAVFTLLCAAVCAASPIGALSRAGLPARTLRATTYTAAAITAGMTAVTVAAGVCLAKVLIVGQLGVVGTAMAVVPVAVLVVACSAALTSTARGLGAARAESH